jgi:hypothetical protein
MSDPVEGCERPVRCPAARKVSLTDEGGELIERSLRIRGC